MNDSELLKRILTVLDTTESPCGGDSVVSTSIMYNDVFTDKEKTLVHERIMCYNKTSEITI